MPSQTSFAISVARRQFSLETNKCERFTQQQNFGPYGIESICRRQNNFSSKWLFLSLMGWKTLWAKDKLLVTSIFSFSHNVFKSIFSGAVRDCMVTDLPCNHNPLPYRPVLLSVCRKQCGKKRHRL